MYTKSRKNTRWNDMWIKNREGGSTVFVTRNASGVYVLCMWKATKGADDIVDCGTQFARGYHNAMAIAHSFINYYDGIAFAEEA